MNKKKLEIAMIVGIVLIAAYDLYLFSSGQVTISRIVWDWNRDLPIVPFLGRLVAGHLWWK